MYEANTVFSEQLLAWYNTSFRVLPWRETKDPYAIWLSEVILQQTRVEQGTKYYFAFLENFPTILDLANAPQDEVLRLWQGLGYYSRARNLHKTAIQVRDQYNGVFPSTYSEILALPGIGPYTAAAIASFAFNIPEAVVDGNVYRFLSRVFEIQTPIDSSKGQKEFKLLAQSLLSLNQPGDFNQAMIEFGAMVCKPANPLCESCVFRAQCYAYKNQTIKSLPVKSQKTKVRNRNFIFLIFENQLGQTLIQKRSDSDIWAGLYQFPLIELEQPISDLNTFDFKQTHPIFKSENYSIVRISDEILHVLSHQKLITRFIHVRVDSLPVSFFNNAELSSMDQLQQKAFPRIITRYLERE
jgi:A/G-specific adenine glycosylase